MIRQPGQSEKDQPIGEKDLPKGFDALLGAFCTDAFIQDPVLDDDEDE